MSEDNKDDKKPEEALEQLPEQVAKELEMYKDYLRYTPIEEMAVKYKMSPENIYKISRTKKWKEKRQSIKEEQYKSLDKRYKAQIVNLFKFIENDLIRLMQRCSRENREMTKEERKHALTAFEVIVKESRLTEGRPTEITDGNHTVRHEVILPPGVKRFGVIPPARNVTQVDAKEVKEEPKTPEDDVGDDDED